MNIEKYLIKDIGSNEYGVLRPFVVLKLSRYSVRKSKATYKLVKQFRTFEQAQSYINSQLLSSTQFY